MLKVEMGILGWGRIPLRDFDGCAFSLFISSILSVLLLPFSSLASWVLLQRRWEPQVCFRKETGGP